ncbi:hypothetical protein P7K49_010425 [Saguinus oedipus]|uniref:Uncharacterized protein n=1 Tax=Saguinus oedipus TaxID=9490 RepID=A0ABQ9VP60_SAGOE|nr:hypothetical protein P7K49_010425 [Saguinus oedipus]
MAASLRKVLYYIQARLADVTKPSERGEYPTLTTFFEGEIISKKHPFLTRKWDADEDVDRKHWITSAWGKPCETSDSDLQLWGWHEGKFLAFYQYAKSFNSDDFDYEELKNGDYVFMRWKLLLAVLLVDSKWIQAYVAASDMCLVKNRTVLTAFDKASSSRSGCHRSYWQLLCTQNGLQI